MKHYRTRCHGKLLALSWPAQHHLSLITISSDFCPFTSAIGVMQRLKANESETDTDRQTIKSRDPEDQKEMEMDRQK